MVQNLQHVTVDDFFYASASSKRHSRNAIKTIMSRVSLKLDDLKNYLGEFFKEKAQKFAIEIDTVRTENHRLQLEFESSKNETQKKPE